MSRPTEKGVPKYATFLMSGIAGCGTVVFLHPIDVVKFRMQLSGEGGAKREHKSSLHAFGNIARNEGVVALYDGFSANIARQICYTMTRLGIFQICIDRFKNTGYEGLGPQIMSSSIAGLIASIVATPTDVAMVRMTSDRRLPEAQQRKYKHVVDAVFRISKEEGAAGLWAGAVPSVLRAVVGNIAQLVTYVQTKSFLLTNDYIKEGIGNHFLSSLVSGFVYASTTNPLDVAKTRMQNMKVIDGVPEYKNLFDVLSKTVRKEGFSALWKGFGPYYFRIAPNTILLFIFIEQLNRLYKKYIMKDPKAKGGL